MHRFIIVLALCAACFLPSLHAEPPNLSLVIQEVEQYHDSGAYAKELAKVIHDAHTYLEEEVMRNNKRTQKKALALVLDIDETSLSNYDHMLQRQFSADKDKIRKDILAADAPAIKPMLALYREALKQKIRVFFVTGRDESLFEATKNNLERAGYAQWSGLYLRPETYSASSIVPFKKKIRSEISKKGFTIIASIGDQYSDLLGGYAKKVFKLPNPYYFLP